MLPPVKFTQWFGKHAMLKTWLALLACIFALPASAHLLNMTEVEIRALDQQNLSVQLQIDLSRQFDSRADYYQLTQLSDPINDVEVTQITHSLFQAMEFNNNGVAIDKTWTLTEFTPAPLNQPDYENLFNWPKVLITAEIQLAQPVDAFTVTFRPSFIFEEPIAATLAVNQTQRTRWLVAHQTSPQLLLATNAPTQVAEQPYGWRDFSQHLRIGFAHIIPVGLDHILFILLLCLLCQNLRQGITAITLFTVAHGVTLSITLMGWVRSPVQWVEVLIAATIVWAAFDVFRRTGLKRRHLLFIFCFGLIHGLGFSSAIGQQSIDANNLLLSLLALNLGVELGQLLVAAATLVAMVAANQRAVLARLRQLTATAVGLLGIIWIINRLTLLG
jgi:hypothetical protein